MAGRHIQKRSDVSSRPAETGHPTRRQEPVQTAVIYEKRRQDDDSAPWRDSRRRRYPERESRDDRERGNVSRGMRVLIPVMIVLLVLLLVLIGTLVAARRVSAMKTIYPNVSVNGIDVGGLTVEEAAEKLDQAGANPYKDRSITILFPLDHALTITADELGLGGSMTAAAEAAYAQGRSGSLLQRLRAYRSCKKTPVELTWDAMGQMDETALMDKITGMTSLINDELLRSEAQIGEDGITLVKGMSTAKIEPEPVFETVKQAFLDKNFEDITGQLTDTAAEGDDTVLQTVYDTIYTEPVNSMYDRETGGATESVRGVSFDMEAARALWDAAQPGEEVFIPFIFTEPEIDSETLLARLFSDCLSEKSTSLSGSSSARINNITLAAQAMNGTVINPGETFDYNSCLGERTTAKGYQEAGAYANGKHVLNVGGGICQGSSTLYYCALYANLQITVRDNHYFVVSYLPWGLDATVSWGGPDFRFVNSRDYPVEIKAWVSGGSLTVQIWGTDVDGSYVRITSETWEDSEHYYAQTYRTVYAADGTQLSSVKEAYSRYFKYEAGEETPAPDNSVTPTPRPTDTPKPTETTAPTPTAPPANDPTAVPTTAPTAVPTAEPTAVPTAEPTAVPTAEPTAVPTAEPTAVPPAEPEQSGE